MFRFHLSAILAETAPLASRSAELAAALVIPFLATVGILPIVAALWSIRSPLYRRYLRRLASARRWWREQCAYAAYCRGESSRLESLRSDPRPGPCSLLPAAPVILTEADLVVCPVLSDADIVRREEVARIDTVMTPALAAAPSVSRDAPTTPATLRPVRKPRRAVQSVQRAANAPVERPDYSRLTYRELQKLAKSRGIRANQSADALRAALVA